MRIFSYLFALSCAFPAYSSLTVDEFLGIGTKRTVTNAHLEERPSQPKKMKPFTKEDIKDFIAKAAKGEKVNTNSILERFKGDSPNTLVIRNKEITGIEAITLISLLRNTGFYILDLSDNSIGCNENLKQNRKIAKDLADALKETDIHTVILSDNSITSAWAVEFTKNLSDSTIHTVDLARNKINSNNSWKIAENLHNANVHTVYIRRGNTIEVRAQRSLKEKYPNIIWDFD
jgi:hypothetical protein